MSKERQPITPPPPPSEDPNATVPPPPPQTFEEMSAIYREAAARALREEQVGAIKQLEKDVRIDSVAGPKAAGLNEELKALREKDQPTVKGLAVKPSAGGLTPEESEQYRAWLERKLAGLPRTEYPPKASDETEES